MVSVPIKLVRVMNKIVSASPIVIAFCLFNASINPLLAEIDDLQIGLSSVQPVQLRWFNVEGGDEWLSGKKPVKHDNKHHLSLLYNEVVQFIIPPSAQLRLKSETEQPLIETIEVEQSLDGRVFLRRELSWIKQGESWLLDKFDNESSIIRITGTSQQAVNFTIYYSSEAEKSKLAHYRSQINLDAKTALISSLPDHGSQIFHMINSAVPQEVEIKGPVNLEIQMRRPYKRSIPANGDVLLNIEMDAKPYKKIYFEYTPDIKRITHVNGIRESLSSVVSQYLFVPEGRHKLSLRSYSDIFLRLLQQDDKDYFSFELNKPSWLANSADVSTESKWRNTTHNGFSQPENLFSDQYLSIQNLTRDNQLVNSGLSALRRLENLAIKNPDQSVFQRLLDKNISRHGRFRNLLPEVNGLSVAPLVFRLTSRRLLRPGENNDVVLDENHTDYYLKSLIKSDFYSLSNNEVINYKLPELDQDSYLRIALLPGSEQSENILIELDDGTRFYLNVGNNEFDQSLFKPNVATRLLASKCCDEKVYRYDRTQIKHAGMIMLPVNKNIRSFSISGKNKITLLISAQIYLPDNYHLDEEQYVAQIHLTQTAAEDYQQLLLDHVPSVDETHNLKAVENITDTQNDWLVRVKRYASKYQNYTEGLDIENAIYTAKDIYAEHSLQVLQDQAQKMENENQWILALEYWSAIVMHSNGDRQRNALFNMIGAMNNVGQFTLSEKLLRALALQSKDRTIQTLAVDSLLQRYMRQSDEQHVSALYLSLFMRSGETQWLPGLIRSLVSQGEWMMALQLTHLLAEDTWPHESVLLAAGSANWWQTYSRALTHLSLQQRLLWQGHEHFFQGNYDKALAFYQDAGEHAEDWATFTKNMIVKMEQFDAFPHTDKLRLINEWQSLIAKSPSPKIWKTADWAIRRHGGGVPMLNPAENMRSTGYLSTADTPVELEIIGPVHLQLAVRPLLERSEHPIAKDGWYRVNINNEFINFPINGSVPLDILRVEGSEARPANKIISEFKLAEGIHRVSVSSNQKLIVTAQVKTPVIRLPGVARPTSEQYKAVLSSDGADEVSSRFEIIEPVSTRLMIEYLERVEIENKSLKEILAKAEILYSKNLDEPGLKTMLTRIGKAPKWEVFDNITASAGVRQLENKTWQEESPHKKMYAALFSDVQRSRKIISSGESIGISLFNKDKTILNINTEVITPWFINKTPVNLYYRVDNGLPNKVEVNQGKRVLVEVPQGSHYISITLAKQEHNQFLALQLTEQDGRVVEQINRRNYHIATHKEPLEFTVDGPAWIRIDQLQDDVVSSDYRYVESTGHTIKIIPDVDHQETLLRIFRRVPGYGKKEAEIFWDDRAIAVNKASYFKPIMVKPKTRIIDQLPLLGQEDGTLSYQAALVKRRSIEDEDDSETDKFLELSTAYRYFQANDDVYYQMNLLYRLRGKNPDSLGIQARVQGRTSRFALDWDIKASLFTQQLENSTAVGSYLDLTLKQYRKFQLKSYHVPRFNLFVRAHKLDYQEDEFIDSNIYTQYKDDHLYGIKLSDVFVYKPYLDMAYFAGAKLTSNEDIVDIDNHSFNLGWRQLLADYTLGAKFNNINYHQDRDRPQGYSKSIVSLDMAWERWRSSRNRLQVRLLYQYDFDIDDSSVRLDFQYHTGAGRDYRDFARDEVTFRHLRENHIPVEPNNEIY